MTKGSLIEYQALENAELKQLVGRYRLAVSSQLRENGGGSVALIRCIAKEQHINVEEGRPMPVRAGDFRADNPIEWAEVRQLQLEISEINGRFSEEAKIEVTRVQAKINEIWNVISAKQTAE